jgi:subtilisin family serine protease
MKRLLSTILVVFFTLGITAQVWNSDTKMSPWLLNKYEQQQTAMRNNGSPLRVQGRPVVKYILTLVESTDGDATIKQKGGVVLQDFSNGICAAFLPMDSLGVLDACDAILRIEANEPNRPLNDNTSKILGVDKVRAGGEELPQAFRGEGVLAGVMDVGFDFTHPAFRHDDGTSRIVWFWDPQAENDNPDELGMIYNSPEEVLAAEHSADAKDNDHGSHVWGSMAGRGLDGLFVGMSPEADLIGGYVPLGTVSEDFMIRLKNYLVSQIKEMNLPNSLFEAELSDVFEIVMLYKIFQKADELGKPCVVNWSFGQSDFFESDHKLYEYLLNKVLGPGRIVVASAGNAGGNLVYVKKEADKPMEQDVYYKGGDGCQFDIRIKMDNPFFKMAMTFDGVADTIRIDTRDVVATTAFDKEYIATCVGVPEPEDWDDILGEYDPEDYPFVAYVTTMAFTDGYAGYRVRLMPSQTYPYSDYIKGKILIDTPVELDIEGYPDKFTKVYFSDDNPQNSRGCHPYTIGHPGSMERIITVGAMHQCSSFTNINGEEATYMELGSEEGHLASFSSCGPTVLTGLVKPDVVAPGHNILSVYNSFYVPEDNESIDYKTAYKSEAFGKEYAIWTMSGTSMSSPITAGVIALWLQANPNLTPEDIKGVIQRTSHQPEPEFSGNDKNVYYGWGEIDAYAGLLDILGLTGIKDISKHQPAGLKFRLEGRTLHIDGIDSLETITVFDLSGRPVFRTETSSDGILTLPQLPAGVYAVQVSHRGSTLIRLAL